VNSALSVKSSSGLLLAAPTVVVPCPAGKFFRILAFQRSPDLRAYRRSRPILCAKNRTIVAPRLFYFRLPICLAKKNSKCPHFLSRFPIASIDSTPTPAGRTANNIRTLNINVDTRRRTDLLDHCSRSLGRFLPNVWVAQCISRSATEPVRRDPRHRPYRGLSQTRRRLPGDTFPDDFDSEFSR